MSIKSILALTTAAVLPILAAYSATGPGPLHTLAELSAEERGQVTAELSTKERGRGIVSFGDQAQTGRIAELSPEERKPGIAELSTEERNTRTAELSTKERGRGIVSFGDQAQAGRIAELSTEERKPGIA
ncbi:MAG: hypothetical protein RIG84_14845 [Roseovarius sp.]